MAAKMLEKKLLKNLTLMIQQGVIGLILLIGSCLLVL